MNRRLLLVATLTGGCLLAQGCGDPPAPADHLILVTLDTTRADRIGCYGREGAGTPTLDALAGAGVRFERAYTPVPLTLPAHMSLFTALRPPRTGVHDNGQTRAADGVRTLAELLGERGFFSAAAVGAYPVSRRFPAARGFAAFDDTMADPQNPAGLERDAGQVVDAALRLSAERGERRLFLWVHLFDPHDPYEPPEPFRSRFPDDPYQGEIARVDAAIGRLLGTLEATLGRDRMLVAVVADHGEALGDHGEPSHGFFIYDPTMRVPLILRGPRVPPGLVVDRPVGTVDVLPTLLGLLDLAVPAGLDGVAVDLERPDAQRRGPIYLESELPRRHYGWSALHGAVDGDHKYVKAPRPEWYDLAADPGERHNLMASAPRGAAVLDRWVTDVRRDGADDAGDSPGDDPLLRSLGYVGSGAVAPGGTPDDPKDRLPEYVAYQRAGRLLEAGRPADALPLLDELLARESAPGARFKRGQALRMLGRLDEATRVFLDLADDDPAFPGVDLELARIAVWEERPDDALPRLERHLAEHPTDAEARMFRGAAHEMLGHVARAEADYRQALARNPAYRAASLRLGALLLVTGREDEARRQLRDHLSRHPQDEVARGLFESLGGPG